MQIVVLCDALFVCQKRSFHVDGLGVLGLNVSHCRRDADTLLRWSEHTHVRCALGILQVVGYHDASRTR